MGRRYATELAELSVTYQRTRHLPEATFLPLRRLIRQLCDRPTVFVGSGGTLALAALAADEHTARTGSLARCLTPLQLATIPDLKAAAVVFSARARHPDVLAAARAARAAGSFPVVLVTQLAPEQMRAQITNVFDQCVSVTAGTKDGFLATNSILATAAFWLASAGYALPERLPLLDTLAGSVSEIPDRVLVLHDPWCRAVAVDVEARLSETGLAEVQLADFRNLAHGRHVGFSRRSPDTLVLPIFGPHGRELAVRTLEVLPVHREPWTIASTLPYPVTNLDCLVGSMKFVGALGDRRGDDPGRPHVSNAGRRLYHLPWQPIATASRPRRQPAAIARKLAAANASGDTRPLLQRFYADALGNWLHSARATPLAAVLLDYDGTCCETDQRLEPPPTSVVANILRLLGDGLTIGFASGRGRSLPAALRQWIPASAWNRVIVGLYNGAVIIRLEEDVPDQSECTDTLLVDIAERLEPIGRDFGWSVELRTHQVTVSVSHKADIKTARSLVQAFLGHGDRGQLHLVGSGHSLDIVRTATTKRRVYDALSSRSGAVLAIGDQGDPDGNDFELLATGTLTLSVDRVSADADRCWNLGEFGQSATELLAEYLSSVQRDPGGTARLSWPQAAKQPNKRGTATRKPPAERSRRSSP